MLPSTGWLSLLHKIHEHVFQHSYSTTTVLLILVPFRISVSCASPCCPGCTQSWCCCCDSRLGSLRGQHYWGSGSEKSIISNFQKESLLKNRIKKNNAIQISQKWDTIRVSLDRSIVVELYSCFFLPMMTLLFSDHHNVKSQLPVLRAGVGLHTERSPQYAIQDDE